jgi:hypothetical protein
MLHYITVPIEANGIIDPDKKIQGIVARAIPAALSVADTFIYFHSWSNALATLSEKLSTPLQFEYYLTRALEEAYKVGQKPVDAEMIETVLARDLNGLEPRLTRQGYNAKVLAELLNAKPREVKLFPSGQLAPGRTQELQAELLAVGIPL